MHWPASAAALQSNIATAQAADRPARPRLLARPASLIARRELVQMLRGRSWRGIFVLLLVVAWLPPLLLALRAGGLGLAPFRETVAFALAFGEVALPLVGLLAGADLLAGESEDGTLISLISLPLSRTACLLGKFIGRAIVLMAGFAVAFGSAALAIGVLHGFGDLADYAAVAGAGLALCFACVGIGAALGTAGRGRTRAFGAALVAWIVMVFALDAAILAAVVALAPPAPGEVGVHGYGEMSAQMEMMKLHSMDDDGASAHPARAAESGHGAVQWLMALDPVDLFRLSVLSTSPTLAQRAEVGVGENPTGRLVLAGAWLAWLILPLAIALRRFSRTDLR
jgi:Cu-processing system permease protein